VKGFPVAQFILNSFASLQVLLALFLQTPSSRPATPAQDQILSDFGTRVRNYVEFRKKKAGSPPKPTTSAAKLDQNREQMASGIREARSEAKQGDIFTPEIATYFRTHIAASLTGPNGAKIRTSLRDAEPVKGFRPQVNESYPEGVPRQSTPPSLLMNLPRLPKELEYRIVDHDLLLLDAETNMIVDFISGAIPAS
jgi:hypothetical protein